MNKYAKKQFVPAVERLGCTITDLISKPRSKYWSASIVNAAGLMMVRSITSTPSCSRTLKNDLAPIKRFAQCETLDDIRNNFTDAECFQYFGHLKALHA